MFKTIFLTILTITCLSVVCFSEEEWQDVTFDLNGSSFMSITEDATRNLIYAGTERGLFLFDEKRRGWEKLFACRGENKGINHIEVDRGGTVYIATGKGLYKSGVKDTRWICVFNGVGEENLCTYVLPDKTTMHRIYLGTRHGLFFSADNGRTWKKAKGTLGDASVLAITRTGKDAGEKFFIVCDNEAYRFVPETEQYEKIFGFSSFEEPNEADGQDENAEEEKEESVFGINDITAREDKIYLSTNRGLFISRDEGVSWEHFNEEGLLDEGINAVVPAPGGAIYAATQKGIFWYSPRKELWEAMVWGMGKNDAKKLLLTEKGSVWTLCGERIYRMEKTPTRAFYEYPPNPDEIAGRFNNEPSVNETMQMAIAYAEVYPEKIERWRKGARWKAILPKVNFGLDQGFSDTYEIYTSSAMQYWVNGPADWSTGWDINFSWDLGDLIWNESQTSIDVRSKLMVQLRDDILDDVTRTYFERRRLQIENMLNPPKESKERVRKELRIQELTATLDGLTGSKFSQAIR